MARRVPLQNLKPEHQRKVRLAWSGVIFGTLPFLTVAYWGLVHWMGIESGKPVRGQPGSASFMGLFVVLIVAWTSVMSIMVYWALAFMAWRRGAPGREEARTLFGLRYPQNWALDKGE